MEAQEARPVPGSATTHNVAAEARRWSRFASKGKFLMPLLAVVAVVLVACGGSASDSNAAPTATGAPSGDTVSGVGSEDQDSISSINLFQGQVVIGSEQIELRQLQGNQPLVVNFWAGLCQSCRSEMAKLQELYDQLGDRVIVVGVALGDFTEPGVQGDSQLILEDLGTQDDARDLLNELGITYPAGYTTDRHVIQGYELESIPSTVFINLDGEIVASWTGPADSPELLKQVHKALNIAPYFAVNMFQGQNVVGGEQVGLTQLLGTKPIVINFWAGLCPPCRAEMPDLQRFYEEFSDRVLLLGVDLGQFTGLGSQEDAQKLLQELGVTYPAGSTDDASVIPDYRVLGMPTTVFIDGNGEIFNNWTGPLNEEVLREKTLEMLDQ